MEAAVAASRRATRHLVLDVMQKDQAAIHTYRRLGFVELGRGVHVVGAKKYSALAFTYGTGS